MDRLRVINNYIYFKDIVGENQAQAIKKFREAKPETENPTMIISEYDDCGGFCMFQFISSDSKVEFWEFMGTAKQLNTSKNAYKDTNL